MNIPKTPRRKAWSQPLADLVTPCIEPAIGRFGFSEADLLLYWPDIVGERLAARCEPLRLQWPPRTDRREGAEPATLIVRVEGAFALDLQHQAGTVVERVNQHLGWRCVGRIALRQGPVAARTAARPPVPPADPDKLRRARDLADGIVETDLRDALVRLGGRVLLPDKAG